MRMTSDGELQKLGGKVGGEARGTVAIYWQTFHITASQPTTLPLAAMLFLLAPWDKPDRLREEITASAHEDQDCCRGLAGLNPFRTAAERGSKGADLFFGLEH